MKKVFLIVFAVAISCTISFANSPPVVSNVSASQRSDGSGIVDIHYTLSDADNDQCEISISVSDDGGSTWDVSASSFTGDIGEGIYPGSRYIKWYSNDDLPGEYGTNYRVKIFAEDNPLVSPIPDSHFMRFPPASDVNTTSYQMGDHFDVGWSDELPIHTVTLNAFYICKYETTNQQYRDYLSAAYAAGQIVVDEGIVYASDDTSRLNPYFITYDASSYSQIGNLGGEEFIIRHRDGISMSNHPVVMVSWYGAKAFCDFYGYRLPTEAEWECAARDGSLYNKYTWGTDSIDSSKCNYNCNNPLGLTSMPYTTEVGRYGQYETHVPCDMAGNVWEWCNDWYSSSYYSVSPQNNPKGPSTGSYRVLRGGSWLVNDYLCRVAIRYSYDPFNFYYNVGFRVCR